MTSVGRKWYFVCKVQSFFSNSDQDFLREEKESMKPECSNVIFEHYITSPDMFLNVQMRPECS